MAGGAELGRGPGDMASTPSIPQGEASCPTASAGTAGVGGSHTGLELSVCLPAILITVSSARARKQPSLH